MDSRVYLCVRGRDHHTNNGNKHDLHTVLTFSVDALHRPFLGSLQPGVISLTLLCLFLSIICPQFLMAPRTAKFLTKSLKTIHFFPVSTPRLSF